MTKMVGKVPPPKWAVLLFLAILVLHTVIGSILILLQPDLGILFGELLTLLIPTVLAVAYLRADFRATLRLRLPSAADVLLAVPLAVALAVLNDQLSNLTSQVYPIPEAQRDAILELLRADTPYEWAVRIFGLAVAAAVSEEILFRGFIQTSLERGSLGRGGAIFLTSFLFAAIHLIPQGMPSYVLAGAVLGITAVATESILIPIVIHAVNNTAAILLINVADMDSLGQPVGIPPQILIPAVLIFAITLAYYVRRMSESESPAAPSFASSGSASEPNPAPTPEVSPEHFVDPDPAVQVLKRKTLGWLAVGCAAVGGFLVVFGLFLMSLLYLPQVRDQRIRDMQQDLLDTLPPSSPGPLASRITEEFDALLDFNESGQLGATEFLRLVWINSAARVDGTISEEEIEAILTRIRLILRENTRVRHL